MEGYPVNPHSLEIISREEMKTRTYFDKISNTIRAHNAEGVATWIFGDGIGSTALDAHTVVFIARLIDASRSYLIPENVLEYGNKHLKEEIWIEITKGRRTTLHTLLEE